MDLRFPLSDVNIHLVESLPELVTITYKDHFTSLNQTQFKLHVPEIADFYVADGSEILVLPLCDPIDKNGVELYLNGSILGACLHQQFSLPLHGSSISFQNKGIIICGESGAGKSTLSYGLSQLNDFMYISDDVTCVRENNGLKIKPLPGKIKLWADSASMFDLKPDQQSQVRRDIDKFFVAPQEIQGQDCELSTIIILQKKNSSNLEIDEIKGAEKFEFVMDQIYRKEYLKGMKATEVNYFKLIGAICDQVPIYRITRGDSVEFNITLERIEKLIRELN